MSIGFVGVIVMVKPDAGLFDRIAILALTAPGLGDEQVAEVNRLRDEGGRLHKTGGHSQSMDTRV